VKFIRYRRLVACAAAIAAATTGVAAPGAQQRAQQKKAAPEAVPLQRNFRAHEEREYGIQLKVHIELPDGALEIPEAKLPSDGAVRGVEVNASWQAAERISSVDTDGTAEVEETLSHFRIDPAPDTGPAAVDLEGAGLRRSLRANLEAWATPAGRVIHYRETPSGKLARLDASSAPNLEEAREEALEDASPAVTEWLAEALRPAVVLPQAPMKVGDQWRQPLEIAWKGWSDIRAFESGEWLKPTGANSGNAVSLLTSKQITARVTGTREKLTDGNARVTFHAESLATFSLWDGHTISATRSAVRDIARSLAPVAGSEHPAVVHRRLAVQVELRECTGGCGGQ
jgi:hypothetical protein